MSRSEHGNARDRTDPVDRARKRRIKALTLAERRRAVLPAITADAIAITQDASVEWPASIADLRGVMDRLPAGALTGLGRIAQVVSPGAYGEMIAGVRVPHVVGDYDPDGARIQLYAFLCDQPMFEIYLRLHMLATLVHEIGHHVDHHARFSRQRDRGDRIDTREQVAEAFAEVWLENAVIPYLEQAYPHQLAELRAWLLQHAGVEVPLEVLLGPSPLQRLAVISSDDAFFLLLGAVRDGKSPTQAKVDFAFNLHYGYEFELALSVLDAVLISEPEHAEALEWRAHVLWHLASSA